MASVWKKGMRISFAIAVAAATLAPGAAAGQGADNRELVRRAVLDYVEGFYEGDSTKFVRSVSPDVFKSGYFIPRDSSRYVSSRMPWPEFHAYANRVKASGRPTPATAPKEIAIYDVLDQTASAKLTAYWGIDYLLLAKRDGRWQITHVLWQTPPRTP
jgi:hypothetical protein